MARPLNQTHEAAACREAASREMPMGTQKTLPAIILKNTTEAADDPPPLGYLEPAGVTYQGDRVIREAKVKLLRREDQDSIKIAVEILDGQTLFLFRLATMKQPNDPPNFVDLQPMTGSVAAGQIAEIETIAPHRAGYHWTVYLGEYPDSDKKHFRSRIELSQMRAHASESLRFLVTHRPNTWGAGHLLLESAAFPPHP